jgi:hypothetical protein
MQKRLRKAISSVVRRGRILPSVLTPNRLQRLRNKGEPRATNQPTGKRAALGRARVEESASK